MPVAPPPLPGKMMTRTMLVPPVSWERVRCFASAAEEWKGSTTSRQSGWVHQISVPRVMSPRSMPRSMPCEMVRWYVDNSGVVWRQWCGVSTLLGHDFAKLEMHGSHALWVACFSAAGSLWRPPSRSGAPGGSCYSRRASPHGPSRHTARPWHLLLALFFFDADVRDGRRRSGS